MACKIFCLTGKGLKVKRTKYLRLKYVKEWVGKSWKTWDKYTYLIYV